MTEVATLQRGLVALAVLFAFGIGLLAGALIFAAAEDDGWSREDVWEICASGVIDECTIQVTP